jgi:broad specificity polyphosphatase/5'/3'-nucleotidase SurE
MDLRTILRRELKKRQQRNSRYSIRAFAKSLATHHSTLTRILRSDRRLTPRSIETLGARLKMTPAEISEARREESCALILRTVRDPRFRPDSRWIATMTGIPTDQVNIALHWLLHERRLVMTSRSAWSVGSD